jgi:hypothetical protein
MPKYRIFSLTSDDHIDGAPALVFCENDSAALKHAKRMLDGHNLEVWEGDRRVSRLNSTDSGRYAEERHSKGTALNQHRIEGARETGVRGLYRSSGAAFVTDGLTAFDIPEEEYRASRYLPDYDDLPSKDAYRAVQGQQMGNV